jgi:hypothetical protein
VFFFVGMPIVQSHRIILKGQGIVCQATFQTPLGCS